MRVIGVVRRCATQGERRWFRRWLDGGVADAHVAGGGWPRPVRKPAYGVAADGSGVSKPSGHQHPRSQSCDSPERLSCGNATAPIWVWASGGSGEHTGLPASLPAAHGQCVSCDQSNRCQAEACRECELLSMTCGAWSSQSRRSGTRFLYACMGYHGKGMPPSARL